MATSEGIPSSIDIEFLELNDNPYIIVLQGVEYLSLALEIGLCRFERLLVFGSHHHIARGIAIANLAHEKLLDGECGRLWYVAHHDLGCGPIGDAKAPVVQMFNDSIFGSAFQGGAHGKDILCHKTL